MRKWEPRKWWTVKGMGRKEEEKPGPRKDNAFSLLDHRSDLPGIARAAEYMLETLMALCAPGS